MLPPIKLVGADLYVRPNTRRVSINKIVCHPIYGNQNQMAQAVDVVRCPHFFNSPVVSEQTQLPHPPIMVSIDQMDECIDYARATCYGKNRTADCVSGRQTALLCFGINGVGHLFRLQCDGLIVLGFDIESGRG